MVSGISWLADWLGCLPVGLGADWMENIWKTNISNKRVSKLLNCTNKTKKNE